MKLACKEWGRWLALSVGLVLLSVACGCKPSEAPPAPDTGRQAPPAAAQAAAEPAASTEAEPAQSAPKSELEARMETSMGTIVIRLAEDKAPNTVANFVHLASKGFYNGLIFHRVAHGFVIQGGCPEGTGMGGPGYAIPDEFSRSLRHLKAGVVSMANSGPNSSGSQFFITLAPEPFLDNHYNAFGQVVDGMDVVQAIGALPVTPDERPLDPPKIERIVLLRDGVELTGEQPMPKTVPNGRGGR
jgi:cyclophilin family peptidyl-prolyl cis-trans isomerase